jgi:putative ATPase
VYPHDDPSGWVNQRYLPDGVDGPYYEPSRHGEEAAAADRLDELQERKKD